MEAVVEPGNLKKALARVRRNKGAPGVDGMTVDELGDHLNERRRRPTVGMDDGVGAGGWFASGSGRG